MNHSTGVLFVASLMFGCGVTFKNSNPLGLNNIPSELLNGTALKEPGPYKYEPNLLVGRLIYVRSDAAGKCPTVVKNSDQLAIGTKTILAANETPKTKEPVAEPLVDGKLVIKANQSGQFGSVTQSIAGEGVYTVRIIETKYSIVQTLPTAELEAEAKKPLPKGYCQRLWVEWTQVLHGGSKLYTKLDAKAAGSTAAFKLEGEVYVESTNVQNRFIVNMGLRELLAAPDVERIGDKTSIEPISVPHNGFAPLDDSAI